MSTTPTVVAVVSGPDGYTTAYVSFKDIIDAHGSLTGVPTIESQSALLTITEESISFAGTVNDVPYAEGQMLTFKVTSAEASPRTFLDVLITWTTESTKATHEVTILKLPSERQRN